MAGVGEEDLEYESDPEEAKLLLTMRRREASDDEGEEEGESSPRVRRPDSRAAIDSDYESDGQGAADEYEEEESEIEEEEELNAPSEVLEEYVEEDKEIEAQKVNQLGEEKKLNGEFVEGGVDGDQNQNEDGDGEKKENEPFAVPTAGAFYMHDDRFRDSAGGRNRRTLNGRKLWESKDNRKWGHDKFEELTMEDPNYDNRGRRAPRGGGRYRGRGKARSENQARSENRGYHQGNKQPDAYVNNRQNNAPAKSVRGRGPKRYQPASQNYREAPTQNRQHGQSVTVPLAPTSSSKAESNQVSSRKNTFASSLNSASPPFYPSKETGSTAQKTVRGKNVAGDSLSMDKLYIDDSIPIPSGKPLTNLEMPSLINSTNNNYSSGYQRQNNQHRQAPQTRFQQVSRSPPKSVDSGEVESSARSGGVVVKGRGNVGRSVMSYSGPSGGGGGDQNFPATPAFLPVMQFPGQHSGGMGVPAVGMAFPGYVSQPQLGLGKSEMTWLPVLASAAGAMGATYCSPYLAVDGAATSAYQPVSGQASSLAISSKENNVSKTGNEFKPSQRLEITNDEFGQRQNKPRRYTEMKFDQ